MNIPWISCLRLNGNVVPCMQISNNELVLGNFKEKDTLDEIWNSEKY